MSTGPGLDKDFHAVQMSERDFRRLSSFIERELGIKMPPTKQVMLESRLARRIRLHGLSNYEEYVDFVFSDEGTRTELIHMIDAVTTNKTDFFREADHFDFLLNSLLPERSASSGEPFTIWSAGCSTGEEPYTMAMVLEEHRRAVPGFSYSIHATDISTKVLSVAVNGVYEEEKAVVVPMDYKKRYLLRSKDPAKRVVRIRPELRSRVRFDRLNLMDESFNLPHKFEVIFCRNVIIYFDRPTQEALIGKFYHQLKDGGVLFLGHSETMTGMHVPFKTLAPTVYRKE